MKDVLTQLLRGGSLPLNLPPASLLADAIAPIDVLTGEEASVGSVLAVVLDESGNKRIGFIPLSSLTE